MRDYLLLYINGEPHRVSGPQVFQPLSTFLRYGQGATGTKVVCEEGDCGACSVMVGTPKVGELSYKVVNSCIQFLYQLDCTHIVTIEGLKVKGELNAVQNAMVECHGAQCGYCTPGFIVAMCGMFECDKKPSCEQDVKDALTGNLCRCTGYEPIIKAGLSVDASQMLKLRELYPSKEMLKEFHDHLQIPVTVSTTDRVFCNPVDIESAVAFKRSNPGTVIVAGGTDVCVYWNKRGIEPKALMSVSHLPNLEEIKIENGVMSVGARVTLTQLENFVQGQVPELHRIMWLFGSPQIRNAATLAGNIANGSPIADTLPFLYVTDAEIEMTGTNGSRRIKINNFYKGYKKLDLQPDEMITKILVPLPQREEVLKLYKVSRRKHLDISAFTAAFLMTEKAGKIEKIRIAYGGVGPIILRLPRTEEFLHGKQFTLETFEKAGEIVLKEITPISDVRGAAEFRNTLAENILVKFFLEVSQERTVACQQ